MPFLSRHRSRRRTGVAGHCLGVRHSPRPPWLARGRELRQRCQITMLPTPAGSMHRPGCLRNPSGRPQQQPPCRTARAPLRRDRCRHRNTQRRQDIGGGRRLSSSSSASSSSSCSSCYCRRRLGCPPALAMSPASNCTTPSRWSWRATSTGALPAGMRCPQHRCSAVVRT